MAGDAVTCPPVPHFWLVKYRFTSSFNDLRTIKNSFTALGFQVYDHSDELCTIKVSHMRPKFISLWFLQNSDLIKDRRLTLTEYTHNTRRRNIKALLT
jgi:hypothetical protein